MPRDCLRIIESKSNVRNSRNKPVVVKVSSSSFTPGISPDVAELKDMVKAVLLDKKNQSQAPALVKAVEESCVTCGGAHSYRNCPTTDGNVYRDNIQEYVSQAAAANFNQGNTSYRAPIANQIRPLGSGTLPSNTITNLKVDLKGITTRSGVAYQGPTIPTTSSSLPKVVERETEVTKDTVPPTNNGSTKDVQPPVVQDQPQVPNSEPVVAPVSAPMPNLKSSIPYPSRRNDERRREKANDQIEKFYEIFKDLSFEISLTDALILMPKFCMRTRSQSRNSNRQQQQVNPTFVEPFNLVEPIENQAPPVVTMDDNRTMAQLLEAPTVGYEDAIVVPEITADNFELKHGLLTLTVQLMLFPFYLEGASQIWLEKEPPRSIFTWDDLVSKFINKFFPPSKTTNLRNEITRFQQRFDETFYEAWDRFNDLLRACPHHGFSELHQLDTFYNALNSNDQDSLNSAAGGNFLDKMPRDCLRIIESKSKVRNSRNKPVVAKVSASSSTPGISPDVAELKDMVKALLLDKKNQTQAPAPVKAVEESCVTCGGAHSYQNCPATDGNVYRDNIQEYVSQAAAANFNQGNTGYRAQIAN
ncbi:reverse transcriptase domain-containing protein [Tanacetum coccineum]